MTQPDPESNRSQNGGTPQYEVVVTVRVRARTAAAAAERIDRWAGPLADYASVESVDVEEPELVTTDERTI
jgi:hypothetical protein